MRARLAANLTTLFPDLPFERRPEAAAALGFTRAEVQYPYALAPGRFAELLRAAGLELVLMNAPPGPDGLGLAGAPAETFAASIAEALDYAAACDCPRLHVLSGRASERLPEAMARARDACRSAGVLLMLEALNPLDAPGYALPDHPAALALLAALGPGAALQFDAYHCLRRGEDPLAEFTRLLPHIGHLQFADAPGRHEPGTGSGYDWAGFFAAIAASRYTGALGCEFVPKAGAEAALSRLLPLLPAGA